MAVRGQAQKIPHLLPIKAHVRHLPLGTQPGCSGGPCWCGEAHEAGAGRLTGEANWKVLAPWPGAWPSASSSCWMQKLSQEPARDISVWKLHKQSSGCALHSPKS